jgi:hypothetical protein
VLKCSSGGLLYEVWSIKNGCEEGRGVLGLVRHWDMGVLEEWYECGLPLSVVTKT